MGLMHPNLAEPEAWRIEPIVEAEHWARQVAAGALIDEIAEAIDMPANMVWQALSTVPHNMLCLLDSPQGWTALAGFVACELGVCAPDFLPAVH